MKRYIIINLSVSLLGLLVGIAVWVYLKIEPIDEAEYNMFVYYINKENKVEQTMLSKKKDDVATLLEYYDERRHKPPAQVILRKDNGSFFIIPWDGKAKLIDTIGGNVAKIQLLYHTKYKELERISGYVPLINLHDTPP